MVARTPWQGLAWQRAFPSATATRRSTLAQSDANVVAMIPETCNAVEKDGRQVLICELPLGHDPDVPPKEREHRMGMMVWKDRGGW